MFRPSKLLALLLTASLLAGCLPTPTPTATPTATLAPTGTPQPISTSTPVPTATATATPAPTATPDPRTTAIRAEVSGDLAHFGAGQAFTVNFDRAMDPASAATPLQVYPVLNGKATWNAAHTALSFAPEATWPGGQEYFVFLDRDLKDVYGKTIPQLAQWKLQVMEGPRLVQVLKDVPERTSDVQPFFRLTFDRAMNRASVEQAVKVEPLVKLEFGWEPPASSGAMTETLKVMVRQDLSAGQVYRFTLGGAAQGVDGMALGRDEQWSYQPDQLRVALSSFTTGKLDLAFNYIPDSAKVIPLLEIDPPVVGEWKALDNLTLEFSTPQDFDPDTQYTIRAKGALPLKDYPKPLEMAPLQAKPASGIVESRDYNAGSFGNYGFTFAVAMDRAKTEAAFSTEPALPGKFGWYDDDHTLLFYPNPGWKIGRYTLTIGTGARDAAGHKVLSRPYQVSMNVTLSSRVLYGGLGSDSPAIFGAYGTRFQALDADGRRAIQLSNPGNLSPQFGLTPLSISDFARRYRVFLKGDNAFSVSSLDDFQDLRPLRTWTATTAGAGLAEVVLPADVPPGLYVLSMTSKDLTDYLFVAITRHTLVVKEGIRRVYVWATDFDNRPAANLEVHLYNTDGSALVEGTTGPDGLWSSAINPEVTAWMALAVSGKPEGISLSGDVAVSGLDGYFSTYDNTISNYLTYRYICTGTRELPHRFQTRRFKSMPTPSARSTNPGRR